MFSDVPLSVCCPVTAKISAALFTKTRGPVTEAAPGKAPAGLIYRTKLIQELAISSIFTFDDFMTIFIELPYMISAGLPTIYALLYEIFVPLIDASENWFVVDYNI